MAARNFTSRQPSKTAFFASDFTERTDGVTVAIPPGSMVIDAGGSILTAYNGTTPAGSLGDGTTVFVTIAAAGTPGFTAGANLGKYYPNGATLTFKAGAANSTAGTSVAYVTYIVVGAGGETQVV